MAEGAPLLREYVVKSRIEGSNPSVSSIGSEIRPLWRIFFVPSTLFLL